MTSHLDSGLKFEHMGMLEEAILEYAKEFSRPVRSLADEEIVQKAHCQSGEVYRKMGRIDEAISSFQQARQLLAQYGVGTSPHMYLAEIMIEQSRFDDAVEILEEYVRKLPLDEVMKQRLAEAREKRAQAKGNL